MIHFLSALHLTQTCSLPPHSLSETGETIGDDRLLLARAEKKLFHSSYDQTSAAVITCDARSKAQSYCLSTPTTATQLSFQSRL